MTNQPVQKVLDALRAADHAPRRSGEGWSCRCPAHEDRKPSLTIGEGDDGRALIKCHRGCRPDDIVAAIGLKMSDLMPEEESPRLPRHAPKAKKKSPTKANPASDRPVFSTSHAAIASLTTRRGPSSGCWEYHDKSGRAIGYLLRWDTPAGKDILPVSKCDGGWAVQGMPSPRPLYRLGQLLTLPPGARVFVVEGEKAADAACSIGLVATTAPHGALSPRMADWSVLRDKEVIILPDNDEAGEEYAKTVAALACKAQADSVRIVRLPGLPDKGDIVEFIHAKSGNDESVAEEVQVLSDAAEVVDDLELDDEEDELTDLDFRPIDICELINNHPELRRPLVCGLLRDGETINVVAAPKSRKSWLVHALAICIARGMPWLGLNTTKSRVLIVDAELHLETLAFRLKRTASNLGVPVASLRGCVDTFPIRGHRVTVESLVRSLRRVKKGKYGLIIVDALYRVLPLDGEENSNETMTRVYNVVDKLARRTGAAVVLVHHTSKGVQSDKAVTDVGSGAGAQSRAPDTHLVLREHEKKDHLVVGAVVRSWPPLDDFVIGWSETGWHLAPGEDPTKLKRRNSKSKKSPPPDQDGSATSPPEWTPKQFAETVVGASADIKENIIARAVSTHRLGKGQADSLFKRTEAEGHVHRWNFNDGKPHRFSTQPPPGTSDQLIPPASPSEEGGGGGGSPAPRPPCSSARGGVGGKGDPPPPPAAPPKQSKPSPRSDKGKSK